VKQVQQQESKAEIVFKRDILLWNKGEFVSLKNFLQIEYDDIVLEQVWQDYNIFLNDVRFNVGGLNLEDRKSVSWLLHSQYVLNEQNHNFKNVKLQIEAEQQRWWDTFLYELGWTPITFVGTTYIFDLEDSIKNIVPYLPIYQNIYNVIKTKGWDSLAIEHTNLNDKTRFKFDLNQKSFTIILQNWEITGIYSWTSKLASSPIIPQDITKYLP